MPEIRVTPWAGKHELVEVRRRFYPDRPFEEDPDEHDRQRRLACKKVWAWQLRAPVPHVIVATALLTDVSLSDRAVETYCQDHAPPNLPFAEPIASAQTLAGAYCSALSQFVTGLTDVEQDGRTKKSMFEIARKIGLPKAFIDLRHGITHAGLRQGRTPGLLELRRQTAAALEWLRAYYWDGISVGTVLDRTKSFDGVSLDIFDFKRQLSKYLKDAVGDLQADCAVSGKEDASTRAKAKTRQRKEKKIADQLSLACQNKLDRLQALADVLLDGGLLDRIPARSQSEGDVQDVWYRMALRVAYEQRSFFRILVDEMLFRLAQSRTSGVMEGDTKSRAVLDRLLYILKSTDWAAARSRSGVDAQSVVQLSIVTRQNPLIARLASNLMDAPGCETINPKYQPATKSSMHETGDSDATATTGGPVTDRTTAETYLMDQIKCAESKVEKPRIPQPAGTTSIPSADINHLRSYFMER